MSDKLWLNVYELELKLANDILKLKENILKTDEDIVNSRENILKTKEDILKLEEDILGTKDLDFKTKKLELLNARNEILESRQQILEIKETKLCPKHIYNPIKYAGEIHKTFLKKYLNENTKVLFIGMNPEYYGMTQTGVPFGNITTVKELMNLNGQIQDPPTNLPNRPITGLNTTIDEEGDKRLWNLFTELANLSIDTFFVQCFVYSFCPVAFFDGSGEIIKLSNLKGKFETDVREKCFKTVEEIVKLLNIDIIVAVGDYVRKCLTTMNSKQLKGNRNVRVVEIREPNPSTDLTEEKWIQEAMKSINKEHILPYFTNHG